ncbi:MAG: helix-turn-helix domain-containing protein [Planctomycetes bacterium]|nr:helix-turn-helix domain-containing protein [Planctomycetota bacterium]
MAGLTQAAIDALARKGLTVDQTQELLDKGYSPSEIGYSMSQDELNRSTSTPLQNITNALAKRNITVAETKSLLSTGYSPSEIGYSLSQDELKRAVNEASDGWVTIASGNNASEFMKARPSMADVPAGTQGLIVIEGLNWFQEKVFDSIFAEQLFGEKLTPAHCKLLDCYGANGKGYVKFEVLGSPVIPIVIAIAGVLIALGIASAGISMMFFMDKAAKDAKWIAIAGVAGIVLLIYLWGD